MSGGEIALIIVVAVVAVLIAAGLFAGRARRSGGDGHRRRPNTADSRSREARMADEVVDSMQQIHARIRVMVAEGRTNDALALARALYKTTERDPARWIADVAEDLRAEPGKPAPDFGPVRRLVEQNRTVEAIAEYRRLTGAVHGEAQKVVDALAMARS